MVYQYTFEVKVLRGRGDYIASNINNAIKDFIENNSDIDIVDYKITPILVSGFGSPQTDYTVHVLVTIIYKLLNS